MIQLKDIEQARLALKGQIIDTPFTHSRTLSEILGAEIWLKFENLQLLHRICHVGKTRDDNVPLVNVPDLKLQKKSEMPIYSQDTSEDIYVTEGY